MWLFECVCAWIESHIPRGPQMICLWVFERLCVTQLLRRRRKSDKKRIQSLIDDACVDTHACVCVSERSRNTVGHLDQSIFLQSVNHPKEKEKKNRTEANKRNYYFWHVSYADNVIIICFPFSLLTTLVNWILNWLSPEIQYYSFYMANCVECLLWVQLCDDQFHFSPYLPSFFSSSSLLLLL